jgi:dipeptidyl-peptidase-4
METMKKTMMTVLVLWVSLAAMAGGKLELNDITSGKFRADALGSVRAMAGGETYAQLSSDGRRIVQYSFKTGKEVGILFDAATVKGDKLDGIDDYMVSPDGRHLLIQTATKRIYRHSFTATYYIYNVHNNRIVPLSEKGAQQTPLFSPDGQQIAFVRDNNIFLVKLLYDNAEVQVTRDGRRNAVINGIPDWVNEEEFGHARAMVFTADSRQLVWVRYDESAVKSYAMPMYKGLKPAREEYAGYPGEYVYKYPIAGEQNAQVGVWSYDIGSRQTRQMQLPLEADGYIPRILMTADSSKVAVCTLNRHQDCLRIYMVNPLSTVCRLAIEEKADKYVRESVLDGIVLTDRHLLLPSDRSGYLHLYLYNLNGQLLRQVDDGHYEVSEVYGFDEATGDTYYASHEPLSDAAGQPRMATAQRVWVARENGRRECLTPQDGWSTAVFSKDFKYFIHTWSDLNTPPVTTLSATGGKMLATLIDNRQLGQQLSDYTLGRRELFTLTMPDGMVLNAWIVKPAGFDATKRYPVIMYQYGGPGNQQVKDAWNIGIMGQGAILEQYLCQQGYLCVCVDNRGTGGRGAAFEKCTYLQLGQQEARDQVDAALWLAQQPYVDRSRIAIWGWSFGGFNALMAMSEGREVFCCGIAIAPPTSWKYYDTIYTERFMRTPQENPSGYADCPISRVGKLSGRLLLCHGMADDNVHFRNTAEYTEALVQADKDFRQLVYTNRNHSIYGGNTRNHLFRQCADFFRSALQEN